MRMTDETRKIQASSMKQPILDPRRYFLGELTELATPRLVVFKKQVEENVRRMRSYLEAIVPGSGFGHLTPHAKTHKSSWVTRKLMDEGVTKFKCTFNELDALLETGVRELLVAYPPLAADAVRIARCARQYPGANVCAQIGCLAHARFLVAAARQYAVEIPCFLDLDVGNRRTGGSLEKLLDLMKRISRDSEFSPLRICGLHAYDGHNHSSDPEERRKCASECMERVARCWQALQVIGFPGERIVVSGTPPFEEDLRELSSRPHLNATVEVSPGTWIYWDTKYDSILPGKFEFAALVLAQVMDVPADDLVTLNLGYKRWAIDQGPVERFSVPGLEFVSASEEHTVLRRGPDAPRLDVGDRLLLAPRHVCATVNLWESFVLMGSEGHVLSENQPVTARNR